MHHPKDRTAAHVLQGEEHVVRARVDGDSVRVGSAGLRTWHTPGHTPESACYLLDERALFTGDTLFLAAVGRPDLEASAEQARRRAHVLHASLQRLLALPPKTVVLPNKELDVGTMRPGDQLVVRELVNARGGRDWTAFIEAGTGH